MNGYVFGIVYFLQSGMSLTPCLRVQIYIYIYNFQCFLPVGSPDLCFQINYVSDASYLHHIYENTVL